MSEGPVSYVTEKGIWRGEYHGKLDVGHRKLGERVVYFA